MLKFILGKDLQLNYTQFNQQVAILQNNIRRINDATLSLQAFQEDIC